MSSSVLIVGFLIFGLGAPKIKTCICNPADTCVVILDRVVKKNTSVTVVAQDRRTVPVTIRTGTKDVMVVLPPGMHFASVKLTK